MSKNDITLVTDVTDNKLYLETVDQEEINLDMDLKDLDFNIKIDKKYDVSQTKSSISKGIIKIVVHVQKDRIKSVVVD